MNFSLRQVDPEHGEINTGLGDFYSLISKEKNNKTFNKTVELWDDESKKDVYAVITFNDENIMPLYHGGEYYIMTDKGKTFANVSEKEM